MKKTTPDRKMSKTYIRNFLFIFTFLFLVFIFTLLVIIFAFEAGLLLKGKPSPFSGLLITLFIVFITIACVFYLKTSQIYNAIKSLEDATEKVAKGDFSIQIPLTKDENINSYIKNFNQMVKELGSMETLKEDFVSNVSHEFKTPLSVIQSYAKALSNPNLDEKTKNEYLEILNKNVQKITNLTTNILNLSRLENQENTLPNTEFLLDEQIRQCILDLEPEWGKKDINFSLTLPQTLILGQQELLAQVWQNIIGNAIKFSNQNGEIAIKILQNTDNITISIADNGIGMDAETAKRIFDKFYQGDTSHSKDGNGLGLALVSRILKICDGEISVQSELTKGTTFTITLPTQKIEKNTAKIVQN